MESFRINKMNSNHAIQMNNNKIIKPEEIASEYDRFIAKYKEIVKVENKQLVFDKELGTWKVAVVEIK